MKNLFVIVLLLLFLPVTYAQNEASFWYFGRNAGLQFDADTGTVTALTNGRLNTLEGCTSISDIDGELLFYSDGRTVWNRNHDVMTNGFGLKGDESSTSSGLIVPKPQDPDFYYIFTVDEPHHENFSGFPGGGIDGDGVNDGLMYSKINITDSGGLGAVDPGEKNVPLITYDTNDPVQSEFKCSEKITAVRADDCSSFWVITHFVDKFYAFKVDTNGVSSTPVISTIGPEVPVEGYRRNALGYLKASPDGTKLVVAHYGFSELYGEDAAGGVYLFDFDNDTGEVSNSLELYAPTNNGSPYGVEFSAENRKVYATVGLGIDGNGSSELIQWDLEAPDILSSQVTIHTSPNLTAGALQLGIDKRIYRAQVDFGNFFQTGRYLGVIQNPELSGNAAGYNEQGVLLDVSGNFQNLSSIGLPPFIQSLFNSQIDIIRNGESTTELKLCAGDSYVLTADELPGADYVWFKDGLELSETGFELLIDSPGFYELFIEPNNGECPIEGSAVVGVSDVPVANTVNDISVCDIDNDGLVSFDFNTVVSEVLGSQDPDSFSVSFFSTEEDALSNRNELTIPYVNSDNEEILYARIYNNDNDNCFDVTNFRIAVFGTPILNGVLFEICDDFGDSTDGITEIMLSSFDEEIINLQPGIDVSVSYHSTFEDADLGNNPLPEPYANTTAFAEQLFIRAENTALQSCYQVSQLDLIINPLPQVSDVSIFQCDEDGVSDGFTLFNLNEVAAEIANNQSNRIVTFFTSLNDALNDNNPLQASNYQNTSPLQTVITKVTNTITNCSNYGELTLEVSSTSANNALLEVCDNDAMEDGFVNFDLAMANDQVLMGLPSGLTIDYYATYEDALLETNVLATNFTNSEAYDQTIYARVENANACYGISEVQLKVLTLPNIETESEVVYCINTFPEPLTLTGGVIDDVPNNYLYEWSTGQNTTEIQVNEPGTYKVIVFNSLGCSKERTITVVPSDVATISNIEVTDTSNNNSISFDAIGEGDYEFALNDPNGPYQDEPFFDNLPPDLYTLYTRDKNGCGISEKEISVIGFPRFFTPNGDGVNDFWQIKGISDRNQVEGNVSVFDRYGKLLVIINPGGPGWNGHYNGTLLPANDYWFKVTLADGRTFTSHFALRR
jgi:gliding motility-associated-like protein